MSGLFDGPQLRQFAEVLSSVYDPVSLSGLLLSINQITVDKQAPMNATFGAATLAIAVNANNEGWAPSLLKAVAADRSENAGVKHFFSTYPDLDPARNPQIADPWMAYRLFGGRVFLGRMRVRTLLRKMNNPLNRKVLVIKSGQRQVGKTYTGALVSLVSEQNGYNIAYIDLDKKIYDLRSVAEELALKWEIHPQDMPRQGDEQETRWAQQLASFLVLTAPRKNGVVRWLILDGFRERLPSPGIKALIDQLAISIQAEASFRLILTNYNDPLPLTLLSFEDIVVPLTLEEIRTALAAIHQTFCGQAPSPEEIKMYMDEYASRLALYKQQNPEHVESHLLIHNAAADVVAVMS
jgi:hypothetical protein